MSVSYLETKGNYLTPIKTCYYDYHITTAGGRGGPRVPSIVIPVHFDLLFVFLRKHVYKSYRIKCFENLKTAESF